MTIFLRVYTYVERSLANVTTYIAISGWSPCVSPKLGRGWPEMVCALRPTRAPNFPLSYCHPRGHSVRYSSV